MACMWLLTDICKGTCRRRSIALKKVADSKQFKKNHGNSEVWSQEAVSDKKQLRQKMTCFDSNLKNCDPKSPMISDDRKLINRFD